MPNFPEILNTNIILSPSTDNSKALKDLIKVVDKTKLVLCGGAIIKQYLKDGEFKDISNLGNNDLDLLVPSINDILIKTITNKFKITHIHDYSKKAGNYHHNLTPHDDFYVVLKHKETGVILDVFDYKPFLPIVLNKIKFDDKEILARSAEDQAVTKLLEITRVRGTSLWEISNGPILTFKWLPELLNLLNVCDKYKLQYIWHYHPTRIANAYGGYFFEEFGKTLAYAFENKGIIAKTEPKITDKPIKVAGEEDKTEYKCPECIFDYKGFKVNI